MALIHKLDAQTINNIAAGEVVERPASVAKELIDNALDAGASVIRIEMDGGGIKKLVCVDDGAGMTPEDARMALESHATSKLNKIEDLNGISTLGFRGEALPSIASVSRLELRTRARGLDEGIRIVIEGGRVTENGPCGMSPGTTVICSDLFFNTPARYKFLKKDAAEGGLVSDVVGHAALSRPDVSFRLEQTGEKRRELMHTPGNGDLLSAIHAVFGREAADQMIRVESAEGSPVRMSGYISKPEGARHNRSRQVFLVNGRVVSSPTLRATVDEASKTWFMKGRFPQLVLHLSIPGNLVDVNVHPQKLEVRFWDNRKVFQAVYRAVQSAYALGGKMVTPFGFSGESDAAAGGVDPSLFSFAEEGRAGDSCGAPDIALRRPAYPADGAGFADPFRRFPDAGKRMEKMPVSSKRGFCGGDETSPSDVPVGSGHENPVSSDASQLDFLLNTASGAAAMPIRCNDPSGSAGSVNGKGNKEHPDDADLRTETGMTPGREVSPAPPGVSNSDCDDGSVRALLDARVIGTLFDTYILLEDRVHDDFLVIDQHAAHERILYEALIARRSGSLQDHPAAQTLLVPLRLSVTESERVLLEEEKDWFDALGFEYDAFGENSIVLRAVPDAGKGAFSEMNAAEAFRTALDARYAAHQTGNEPDDTEVFHDMACKAAVKAHDRLSESDISCLIRQLLTLANPYHCPHGRPSILRFSRKTIEKKFGRLV